MKIKYVLIIAFTMVCLSAAYSESYAQTATADLLAGQYIDVGDVTVECQTYAVTNTYNDTIMNTYYLIVTYQIDDPDWSLTQTHLAIADTVENIPQTKKGNPIPGKFEFNESHDYVKEYIYIFEVNSCPLSQQVIIAAHAEVVQSTASPYSSVETAWADGEEFAGRNWATYMRYRPLVP